MPCYPAHYYNSTTTEAGVTWFEFQKSELQLIVLLYIKTEGYLSVLVMRYLFELWFYWLTYYHSIFIYCKHKTQKVSNTFPRVLERLFGVWFLQLNRSEAVCMFYFQFCAPPISKIIVWFTRLNLSEAMLISYNQFCCFPNCKLWVFYQNHLFYGYFVKVDEY